MNLPGIVQPANPGLLGFDTDVAVTASTAKLFFQQGYRFCGRYLSHGTVQDAPDLTNAEAMDILGAGLALFVVQHVPPVNWSPTGALGTAYGTNAVNNAQSIGLPTGMNLWCDLEGINAGTSAQDVIDYCKAWYAAVFAGQYVPGLYVGADAILSGAQLYKDLSYAHYWRSLSKVPDIETRGYQLVQHQYQGMINGIYIDTDATQTDYLGGQMLLLNPVVEQASVTNSGSSEPLIEYSPTVDKNVISAHAIDVIRDMLKDSDNMRARITSSARTPQQQAQAMYNNILTHGVAAQKKLYSNYGDQVIDVYSALKAAGKTEDEILDAMVAKILEIGPEHISRHTADFKKLVVVDIAPSSIANKNAFINAATLYKTKGIITQFFQPGDGDPAFHLEIPPNGVSVS